MTKLENEDPYTYPGTQVLINKFNIRDADLLSKMEVRVFQANRVLPLPEGQLDYAHLKAIHHHFFSDIYEWAGKERSIDISKGGDLFGHTAFISKELDKLFIKLKQENYLQNLNQDDFCNRLSYYFNEINAAHPFREGNGRTQRAFCEVLAEKAGYFLSWDEKLISRKDYIQASIDGFQGNYDSMAAVFRRIASPIHQEQKRAVNLSEHYVNEEENKQKETLRQSISTIGESHYTTKPIVEQSAHELVEKYVAMQVEHERLSEAMLNFDLPPDERKVNVEATLQHSKNMEAYATEIIKHPEIARELEIMRTETLQPALSDRGGFEAIQARIKQGDRQNEDLKVTLAYARKDAATYQKVLAQKQDQTRGYSKGGRNAGKP